MTKRGGRSWCHHPPQHHTHQLPEGTERPDVFRELRQTVVAGVEDAEGQETEAGGQRGQLIAAAGRERAGVKRGGRGVAARASPPPRGGAVPEVKVGEGLEVGNGGGDAAQAVVVEAEPLQGDEVAGGLWHLPKTVAGEVCGEGDVWGQGTLGDSGPLGVGSKRGRELSRMGTLKDGDQWGQRLSGTGTDGDGGQRTPRDRDQWGPSGTTEDKGWGQGPSEMGTAGDREWGPGTLKDGD